MALVACSICDTEENGRSWMTEATVLSLKETVDWSKHSLVLIDNASCKKTKDFLSTVPDLIHGAVIITNATNRGTAKAINQGWLLRGSSNAIKIDNDCVIHQKDWLDILEDCLAHDPSIGIIALKRRDLGQWPLVIDERTGMPSSELVPLTHKHGERWLIIEKTEDLIGTCQLYSSALLDKIGYLIQPGLYGFDDNLACLRSKIAGFTNCFMPTIPIDHVDPGGCWNTLYKQKIAGDNMNIFNKVRAQYMTGERDIYHGPDDVLE